MREELKYKITNILREWKFVNISESHTTNIVDKIADLVDQDQQETRNKINDASIKLVEIADEIKAVLNPKPEPKAEEVHL